MMLKKSINKNVLVALVYCVSVLPFSLIALGVSPDVFNIFADTPEAAITESENLIKDSDKSLEKAATATDNINTKIKPEIEKAKDLKKTDDVKALKALREALEKDKLAEQTATLMTESSGALSDQDKKYAPLITRLRGFVPNSAALEQAAKNLENQKKKADEKIKALNAAKDGLTDPVNNAGKSAETLATILKTQIDGVLKINPEAKDLLKELPDQLPKIVAVKNARKTLDENWSPLFALLKKFVASPAGNAAGILKEVDTSTAAATGKIGDWSKILETDATATNEALIKLRGELDKDLSGKAVLAIATLDETEKKADNLETISKLAKGVAKEMENEIVTPAIELLDKVLDTLKSRNRIVREGLAGDYSKFVNDFVPLYYFTDVYNLMLVLNPSTRQIRDVSALREEAAAARRAVDRADLELSDAQAVVSGLQIRERNLINELKDAENAFNSSSSLLAQAERRLGRFDNTDPTRRGTQDRVNDLTLKKKADEENFNALKNEQTGLPAKIRAAEAALLEAQKNVRAKRNNVITLVQDESLAFAEARDNEQVFLAPNDATSKDPIKQVIIYAFGNRKILYLRGSRENVTKAKNIISFFDRPAPQARLALWSLELNGQPTKKGSQRFSDSLEIVDAQLSNTRAQISTVLALLRKCINNKVNEVADERIDFIPVDQLNKLNGDELDLRRWARSFFYQDEVLLRLGFDPKKPVNRSDQAKIIARNALPDPIGAGTLGEMLVILSLAKSDYRDEIMQKFTEQLPQEIEPVLVDLPNVKQNKQPNYPLLNKEALPGNKLFIKNDPFVLTKKALDVGNKSPYTSLQKEIVGSITLASVPRLIKRLNQFDFDKDNSKNAISFDSVAQKDKAAEDLKKEVQSVLDFLWYSYGISTTDLFGFDIGPKDGADRLVKDLFNPPIDKKDRLIITVTKNLLNIKQNQNIFRLANAQIAKTDNLVKQLIDAFDEDLNRSVIQPTIYGLRRNLIETKIGVGIINRTSLLATNRLVARVDARGSAQLTVGEEQDALLAAQQLGNIFLAAKTGGLLGGLSGLQSTKQERDTSEVYGINSGSVFKVTPIFDPSGQTLRFQFDHTQANLVTEPDGSVQPAMPRIERHTVNTEVQLSNLELREISRFEANSKLGIPTTYKGGIPIFRDIPYVNKIPLLGWFVRRSGKAAEIQESLILGQTTMYPTIADMFDLLSGDDYNMESAESNNCKQDTNSSQSPNCKPETTPSESPAPSPSN